MITDLAAQRAMDRMKKVGVDELTESERIVAAVWLFVAGVGNHGFIGYFKGSQGDLAFAAPDALRAIGAMRLAKIADDANREFGAGGPPKNQKARKDAAAGLPESSRQAFAALDRSYAACDEDVDDLLEAYLGRLGLEK